MGWYWILLIVLVILVALIVGVLVYWRSKYKVLDYMDMLKIMLKSKHKSNMMEAWKEYIRLIKNYGESNTKSMDLEFIKLQESTIKINAENFNVDNASADEITEHVNHIIKVLAEINAYVPEGTGIEVIKKIYTEYKI